MKKKNNHFLMSLRLHHGLGEAMSLVQKTDGVPKTRQIEIGLKLYMEKHKQLLAENNINIFL